MYVQEEPIERIHLYVVPEEEYEEEYVESRRPPNIPRILSRLLGLLCLSFLFTIPSGQDISPMPLTVPLEWLPLQTFHASVIIQPTGVRVEPATNARGMLTVYNGSFLVQQLPRGFIVESSNNVQLVTDASVTIPAANPPALGQARVQAHAVTPGAGSNIPALGVNMTYGNSLYLKNLTAFSGGVDARSIQVATDADRQVALSSARYRLRTQTLRTQTNQRMLDKACSEKISEENLTLTAAWTCQFVQYRVEAGWQVLSVRREGKRVILQVRR